MPACFFPSRKKYVQVLQNYAFSDVRFHQKLRKVTQVGLSQNTTPPKINMDRENRPSRKEISIPTIHFQVLC